MIHKSSGFLCVATSLCENILDMIIAIGSSLGPNGEESRRVSSELFIYRGPQKRIERHIYHCRQTPRLSHVSQIPRQAVSRSSRDFMPKGGKCAVQPVSDLGVPVQNGIEGMNWIR